ncbi:MAG: DNA methyltransferase, partial [Moorellaceae bacterium]
TSYLFNHLKASLFDASALRKGKLISIFYLGKNVVLFLKDYTQKIGNTIYKQDDMNNFWTRQEIPITGIANEGSVKMRRGKKPEALIKRILEISTSPGDWVLDSFLGSGTTAAVAHKLGRKWIGIEMGEHAETLCLPRLKQVVSGEDQTGISKEIEWKGGGGFRYCVLGESLFAKDKDTGLVMINPKYTNGLLVAAVCNLENFKLNNDSIFQGVQGNTFAHITEEKVTQAYLDSLVERLPHGKFLIIYCLKRATGLKIPPEVKIKRIPQELQIPRYLTKK